MNRVHPIGVGTFAIHISQRTNQKMQKSYQSNAQATEE